MDPSEFLDKMKGVQGFNGLASAEMARAWKQTSREGTESFRLIDEALGIHLSRPLTRLLTNEFPAFAKGLQSLLGAGVVGALAAAGFEFGEHIAKSMEKAKRALQDYDDAQRHTQEVLGDLSASHAKAMKEIELRSDEIAGKPGAKLASADFKIDSAAMEEGKKQIGEITEAMEKEAKAAANAKSSTTQFWNEVALVPADFWAKFFGMGSDQADAASAKFKDFQQTIHAIMQVHAADPLQGLRDSLKKTEEEVRTTGAQIARDLVAIQAAKVAITIPGILGKEAEGQHNSGVDAAAVEIRVKFVQALQAQAKALREILGLDQGQRTNAGAEDGLGRQNKALEAMAALQRDISGGMSKLQPETDPIKKMQTEIAGLRMAAEGDFRDIANSAASAFDNSAAKAHLDEYEHMLDRVMAKARQDAADAKLLAALPTSLPTAAQPKLSTLPSFAAPTVMPTLGAGGLAGSQFDAFAKDQAAQLKMAAQAYEDAIGPQQKYKLAEQELDFLLKNKLIDQNAYNAALAQAINLKNSSAKKGLEGGIDAVNPGGGMMQELQTRMTSLQGMQKTGIGLDGAQLNAGDLAAVKLEMQAITEQEDKILLKTGGINAGFNAWIDGLKRVESEGEFTFQLLTQATKGFEDNAVKSFLEILETEKGGHAKLIKELRQQWASFFNGLAEMALKNQLNKLLAGTLGKLPGMAGVFGSAAGAAVNMGNEVNLGSGAATQLAKGPGALFPAIASSSSAAGKNAAQTANTTALTTNTTALGTNTAGMTTLSAGITALTAADTTDLASTTANTAALIALTAKMMASSIASAAGKAAGGFDGADDAEASGTDFAPGGPTWVGEKGPEILDLPRGSSVTPNDVATKQGGGDIHNHYDQRGAVVTDDLMRKGEAERMMASTLKQAVGQAITRTSENRLRTLGR